MLGLLRKRSKPAKSGQAANVVVRDMTAGDRPALLEMIAELSRFEAAFEADRTGERAVNEAYFTDVEAEIAREGGFILVAEAACAGDVIGYLSVVYQTDSAYILPRFRRHAYVSDMFVCAPYRRRHAGRALVDAAEQRVRAAGIYRIGVGALARNAGTRDAYAKLGFRPYAVEYVKDLDPR